MSALDDATLPKITGASNSKEAWDILQQSYHDNDKVKTIKLQTIQTQFETLKMSNFDSVDLFMMKVMGIVNQFHINDEMIADHSCIKSPQKSFLTSMKWL